MTLPPQGFLGLFSCISTSKGNHSVYCKQFKTESNISKDKRKVLEQLASNFMIHLSEAQQLEQPNKPSHFNQSFNFPKGILADLLVPTKAACGKKYIVSLEHLTFISHPIEIKSASIHFSSREHRSGSTPSFTISEDSTDEVTDSQTISIRNISKLLEVSSGHMSHDDDSDQTALHTFNIALVVDNRFIEPRFYNLIHEQIVEKLMNILEEEQISNSYISKQVQNLLQKTERQNIAIEDGDLNIILDSMMDHIRSGRSYAFDLHGRVHTFPNIRNCTSEIPLVQPFQTILLIEGRLQILKVLNEEFASQYIEYLDYISPFMSLSESCLVNDISSNAILDISQLLISLNYAKTIDPISLYNVYRVSESCDLNRVKLYSPNFKTKFGLDLFNLLSRLKFTKPLMQHIYDMTNATKDDPYSQILLDATLDLMRMDFITQITSQVFLKLSNDSSSLLYDPFTLSTNQLEYIDMLSNRLIPPMNEYFRKAFMYFNCKHNLNEIAYRTDLPITELHKLLELLEDHLIVVEI
eukprot:NODE_406_length_7988_cov_0.615794.p2 type:complete len:525 gc:universal NODE_406_length_7988_cov_0.615794:2666-4240(+)